MKFSIASTVAAAASLALAAPAPSTTTDVAYSQESSTEGSFAVPTEAIIGQFSFDADEFPIIAFVNEHPYVILLNATVMEEAYNSLDEEGNEKRDADAKWGWLRFWPGQPFVKRDAEAEAKWGWLRFWPGQPFVKRDAEAEADAKWGWLRFWPGQPFVKREADAEADAKWGWLRFWPGQPFVKREVEADISE